MKRFLEMAILMCLVGGLMNGRANCFGANALPCVLEEAKEIEELIARAPEMILSQTNDVRVYKEQLCRKISEVPDAQMRYSYFRRFMESACSVNFERIDDGLRHNQYQENWIHEQKRANLRLGACYRLVDFAEAIWLNHFFYEQTPPPGGELFEPWFLLIKKLKSEGKKNGNVVLRMFESNVDRIESLYLFIYLGDSMKSADPQARTAIETRFKQIVGRPIRSAAQYKADARRRTEANIREHREQEEKNQRAAEYQKRFNREHNINAK